MAGRNAINPAARFANGTVDQPNPFFLAHQKVATNLVFARRLGFHALEDALNTVPTD